MTENLHAFSERIKATFSATNPQDEITITKALVLYRQGRVTLLPSDEMHLKAKVSEMAIYQVQLDLQFPSSSTCSCGQLRLCTHQLALFFHHYSQTASVSQWLSQWRNNNLQHTQSRKSIQTKFIERDVEKWQSFLREQAEREFHFDYATSAYGIHPAIYAYRTAINQAAPIEKEWARLYRIFANLIALETIWGMTENEQTNAQHRLLVKQLQDEIARYYRSPIRFSSEAFHQEMLRRTLAQLLDGDAFAHTKWVVFCLVWSSVIADATQKEKAIQQLKEQPTSSNAHWGLIHLFIENKQDTLAIQQLNQFQASELANFLFIIDSFHQKQAMHRARPFIEFVIQSKSLFLRPEDEHFQESIHKFSRHLQRFAAENKRFDLVEKFLRNYLPHTRKEYSALLFNKQEYRKWVDLQLALFPDELSLSTEEVQQLYQEQPVFLLPLYHREILREIMVKKRLAYKQAVLHLKQLKEIYRQANRLRDWKNYLLYLQMNFSNLPSFQKELEEVLVDVNGTTHL